MLSYRHAFHAGNYADVLKHLVICQTLNYLTQKDKPIRYIDTHAGVGGYSLTSAEATKTGEYVEGIERVLAHKQLPACFDGYLELVRQFNGKGDLKRYPGSPWFAQQLLRPYDRLELCELHPRDYPALERNFAKDSRVHCHFEDGFKKSLGFVPPVERRGLVLIDPSYEIKDDYQRVVEQIIKMHRRFATGTYALWYPLVDTYRIKQLEQDFINSGIRRIQLFEVSKTTDHYADGMTGSGMIVVNPPWTLMQDMQQALAAWAPLISTDGTPHYRCIDLVGE